MKNVSEMALIDVAYEVLKESNGPMDINDIINKVFELKGIEKTNDLVSKLYVDLTASSKFVYLGNDPESEEVKHLWDLKERQSLDEFDKDGSAFNPKGEIVEESEEEEDNLVEEDEESDEDEEDDDDSDEESDDDDEEENEEESEYDFEEEDEESDDELDDDDSNDFEEDKYNKYMDDYEDMYEN